MISSKGIFYIHFSTDGLANSIDFVKTAVEHWLEREII